MFYFVIYGIAIRRRKKIANINAIRMYSCSCRGVELPKKKNLLQIVIMCICLCCLPCNYFILFCLLTPLVYIVACFIMGMHTGKGNQLEIWAARHKNQSNSDFACHYAAWKHLCFLDNRFSPLVALFRSSFPSTMSPPAADTVHDDH